MVCSFQRHKNLRDRLLQRPPSFSGGGIMTFNYVCVMCACALTCGGQRQLERVDLSLHYSDQTQLTSLTYRYPFSETLVTCPRPPSFSLSCPLHEGGVDTVLPLFWMSWKSADDVGPKRKSSKLTRADSFLSVPVISDKALGDLCDLVWHFPRLPSITMLALDISFKS